MSNAVSALPNILSNLEHVLRLGEANAKERGIDSEVFLNSRLAPDMWPLKKQVQTVAELAKNAPYRVAGTDAPSYDGHPESFEACYEVIAKAKADIAKVSSVELDGKESREFSLKMGPREMDFTGISYLSGFTIPNVYFHMTTVYNILRHNGVPLTKPDFFGGMSK
jgi:hypothetical protein